MNKVICIGRLTKDVELRKTQNGTSVVQFTLAVDRRFKKDGEQEVDFIQCVAWNKTAELMEQYLHKGSLIGVEGRIQTRSYENQQGQRVYVTEVVTESVQFLEPKNNGVQNSYQTQQPVNNYQQSQGYQAPQPIFGYGQSLTASAERQTFEDTLGIQSDDLPF